MTTPPPPSPTTLSARSPDDLIAAAAVVLGFWPADSVVMMTFDGPHPFHARVDLPTHPSETDELVSLLVDPAQRHGVGRVVVLVHTDDARLARHVWAALAVAFGQAGIGVVDALRVTPERWHPLRAGDARGGADGVPYDVAAHPFLAQAVLEGKVTHSSREDLAATLEPDPAAIARVARLVGGQPLDTAARRASGEWAEGLLLDALDAVEAAASGWSPSDADVARLVGDLRDLVVRDAAWTTITRARARAAVDLWTAIVRRTPRELLPAPMSLLAWAAWQLGNGALAWCAIDRCRDVDPGYRLAALVAEALERAVPPSAAPAPTDWRQSWDVS